MVCHALQAQLHGGWLADGHRFLGRRAVRLFRRQPVLGTVVAWLPPARPKPAEPTAATAAANGAADADDADDDAEDAGADANADAPPPAPPSPLALRRLPSRAAAPRIGDCSVAALELGWGDAHRSSSPARRAARRGPLLVGDADMIFFCTPLHPLTSPVCLSFP